MKKLLMLGGSHAEIPMIQAARKLGYYVITTGNQADGLGHPFGDAYINCDFSNKEAITELAREQKVDAICSGCNDFAYLSAAYACEKLELPGHDDYETALRIHHKDKYRALADELGIVTPKAYKCSGSAKLSEACERLSFPVIVKPVDLTGGKGMQRCENKEQVKEAYEIAMKATREHYVVVEEFITGTNHGFSAYIQNQKVTFFFADNEQYYHNPYLVSGASTPSYAPQEAMKQLCGDCEKIAGKLQLKDGILHIQFILKENKTPVIIEVCRRAPGDLYIHLVEMAKGVDYPQYIVGGEAGMSLPAPCPKEKKGYFVRHCVMADGEGTIETVQIADEIAPYVKEQMLWYKKGDVVEDMLKYKAGIVFLHFPTEKEYRCYLDKLPKLIKIKLQDLDKRDGIIKETGN